MTNQSKYGIIILKKGDTPPQKKEVIIMKKQLHCAYNLVTDEILSCSSSNQLKRYVRIITQYNKRYDIHSKWIFGHKGINAIMAKANRMGK